MERAGKWQLTVTAQKGKKKKPNPGKRGGGEVCRGWGTSTVNLIEGGDEKKIVDVGKITKA